MRNQRRMIDEAMAVVDACVFENVLREVNKVLDYDLVFYNYDVELIGSHVTTTCGPKPQPDKPDWWQPEEWEEEED